MSAETERKSEVVSKFRTHEKDTGSPEVQVALLSDRQARRGELALGPGEVDPGGAQALLEHLGPHGGQHVHRRHVQRVLQRLAGGDLAPETAIEVARATLFTRPFEVAAVYLYVEPFYRPEWTSPSSVYHDYGVLLKARVGLTNRQWGRRPYGLLDGAFF